MDPESGEDDMALYGTLAKAFPFAAPGLERHRITFLDRVPAGNLFEKSTMVPYRLTLGQWKTVAKIFQDRDTGEFLASGRWLLKASASSGKSVIATLVAAEWSRTGRVALVCHSKRQQARDKDASARI